MRAYRKTLIAAVVAVVVVVGCVGKGAVTGVERGGVQVGERLDALFKTINDLHASAEKIDQLTQAGVIKYGGAGWVVAGSAFIVLLFLGIGLAAFYLVFQRISRWKNLLALVTGAVQNSPVHAQEAVKAQIEHATGNGGPFGQKHKDMLAQFAKQAGTFATKNVLASVPKVVGKSEQ